MRETRLSGSEGGARSIPCSYPYPPGKTEALQIFQNASVESGDRGRNREWNPAPPSEPDWRISRIRLSGQ